MIFQQFHFQYIYFPTDFRNKLKKKSYEVKSFFNMHQIHSEHHSVYFFIRSHFSMWKMYLEKMNKAIKEYLYHELGHGNIANYFLRSF